MKVLSIDIDYVFDTVDDWPNEDNEMWDNWHPTSKWHYYFCKYPDLNDREKIVNEENLEYLLETYTKALMQVQMQKYALVLIMILFLKDLKETILT